jgi:hypothetical protein
MCFYVLFYNCVQLVQSMKRKYCHVSPLKNKLSAAIVRCQMLLNKEGVDIKIWK